MCGNVEMLNFLVTFPHKNLHIPKNFSTFARFFAQQEITQQYG